jgi:lipoprotein-releasing system ATP-binding protein
MKIVHGMTTTSPIQATSTPPRPTVEVRHVTRRFNAGAGPVEVLRDITLEIGAGESLAVTGPSGSGKSTLLQIMGTLDRPTSGEVFLDGVAITDCDARALADLRNRMIGFVFQAHYLLPQCTVLENVLVPTIVCKDPALLNGADARARRLLQRVGLEHRLNHLPSQLSGGERQRVAVARALVNQPKLVLADEPTGALDHANALLLMELLIALNREERVTLVVVTHALELAAKLGRVIELRDGGITPCAR